MGNRLILTACIGVALCYAPPAANATQHLFRGLEVDSSFVEQKLHNNPVYKSIVSNQGTDAALLITRQPGVILSSEEPLIVPVEPTLNLTVQLHAGRSAQTGVAVWSGSIPDRCPAEFESDSDNSILLVEHDRVLVGSVRYHGQLYQITPITEKIYAVVKVNERHIQDAAEPTPATISTADCAADNQPVAVEIDVLLVLTNQSKATLLDPVATFSLMLAEVNQGFDRSKLPITLRSGGILDLNYDESAADNTPQIMLNLLRQSAQGIGRKVLGERYKNAADQATLLFARNSATESASGNLSNSRDDSLAVVQSAYATGTYLFAQSIGRNLGTDRHPPREEAGRSIWNETCADGRDRLSIRSGHTAIASTGCDRIRLLAKARDMQNFFTAP